MPVPRRVTISAMTLLLTLTAACGGTPPVAPGATGQPLSSTGGIGLNDPCGVLSTNELSAALGVDVVAAQADTRGDTTYCHYGLPEGAPVVALSFSREQALTFDSMKNAKNAMPVPGIGDGAVFSSDTLFVKNGDTVIGIQADTLEVEDTQELIALLTEVARTIIARR